MGITFFFRKVGKFRLETKIVILDINIEYWDFDVVDHDEHCITLLFSSFPCRKLKASLQWPRF